MIIIGDMLVPHEEVFRIYHKEQIAESKANSTIIFKYNTDILSYCSKNDLSFGVIVSTIKEAIYANALHSKYIICPKDIAKEIQTIAEAYMFDAKILAIIENNSEFEKIAKDEIDGVIYKNILE